MDIDHYDEYGERDLLSPYTIWVGHSRSVWARGLQSRRAVLVELEEAYATGQIVRVTDCEGNEVPVDNL